MLMLLTVSKELSSASLWTSKRNVSVKVVASSGAVARSSTFFLFPSASNLFPRICLFCDMTNKSWNGKLQTLRTCQTKAAEMTIKLTAKQKADCNVMGKVDGVDLVTREAWYHECCRRKYVTWPDRLHHRPVFTSTDDGLFVDGCKEQRVAYSKAFTSRLL